METSFSDDLLKVNASFTVNYSCQISQLGLIPHEKKITHEEFTIHRKRLNPETIDSAWIKWDDLTPPEDVKGIFIKFDNDQIWTDAHFRGSDGYRTKVMGNAKPIAWTFMERSDPGKKSI